MKLIIFDFDGVLIDTFIISYEISKEVNENLSLKIFRSLFDGNVHQSLENNPNARQHPKFFERYKEQSRELKIPQLLKDFILELSKNYILSIVSSTPTHLIKDILNRENVSGCFSDILGSDLHKSKVVKNKMLLEKYKIMSDEAVFITDTVGDILEARECGIKSIAVTWGFHEEETLVKAKPDKIVKNPEDLLKAIKEI